MILFMGTSTSYACPPCLLGLAVFATSSVESTIAVVGSAAAVAASNTDKIIKVATGLGLLDAGELAGGGVIRKLAKDQVEEFVGIPSKKTKSKDGKRHPDNLFKFKNVKQAYSASGITALTWTKVKLKNGKTTLVAESKYLFVGNNPKTGKYKQSVLDSIRNNVTPQMDMQTALIVARRYGMPKKYLLTSTALKFALHHHKQKLSNPQKYMTLVGFTHNGKAADTLMHNHKKGIGVKGRKDHSEDSPLVWKALARMRN